MPVATAPRRPRVPALDFTKGALVLIMVLYHWLNYFVSTQGDFYRYLRFLTPSFIFISGFVISQVYLVGYGAHHSQVPRRLVQRGLKILALFVALNLVRALLIPDARSDVMGQAEWSLGTLVAVFVTGNVAMDGTGKVTAFNILVPISYLLLLSAPLVILCRYFKYTFQVACGLVLLGAWVLHLNRIPSGNVELIAIGLLGAAVGWVPMAKIRSFVTRPGALVAAYVAYTAVLAVWGINYGLQIAGVCLNLLLLFMVGEVKGGRGWGGRHVVLLGKYSLFGYIAQIAILQVLNRGLRRTDLAMVPMAAVSCVAAFVLTSAAVEVADRTRLRVPSFDRLYRAVFS